jgi:hypothetical protein
VVLVFLALGSMVSEAVEGVSSEQLIQGAGRLFFEGAHEFIIMLGLFKRREVDGAVKQFRIDNGS